jgi:hypothetical protein
VSGGAYACPSDGHWNFCLFGPHVLAFNGADAPQTFNIDTDTNFSALGGSPPAATYAAPVGDFVVAANTATNRSRVYWSGINDSTTRTPSQATQSDLQELPDGGEITGIVGYSLSGVVFQRRAIRVMSYIGTPLVFQFQKISDGVGATIPGSIASYRDYIFFWDSTGFYMLVGAAQIVPIGDQRVNRYFWNNLNKNFLHRVTAAVDPVNGLYVVSYPSSNSADGTPDAMLVYRWAADRWARCEPGALEMVFGTANQHSFTRRSWTAFRRPWRTCPTAWTAMCGSGWDSPCWAPSARRTSSASSPAPTWRRRWTRRRPTSRAAAIPIFNSAGS